MLQVDILRVLHEWQKVNQTGQLSIKDTIRWDLITGEELQHIVEPLGVLNKDELYELYRKSSTNYRFVIPRIGRKIVQQVQKNLNVFRHYSGVRWTIEVLPKDDQLWVSLSIIDENGGLRFSTDGILLTVYVGRENRGQKNLEGLISADSPAGQLFGPLEGIREHQHLTVLVHIPPNSLSAHA